MWIDNVFCTPNGIKNFSFLFCSRRVIAMSCHSIDYMYVYICTEFSKAQIAFASALGNFSFQTIGEQTEDEKLISKFWFAIVGYVCYLCCKIERNRCSSSCIQTATIKQFLSQIVIMFVCCWGFFYFYWCWRMSLCKAQSYVNSDSDFYSLLNSYLLLLFSISQLPSDSISPFIWYWRFSPQHGKLAYNGFVMCPPGFAYPPILNIPPPTFFSWIVQWSSNS